MATQLEHRYGNLHRT